MGEILTRKKKTRGKSPLVFPAYEFTRSPPSERLEQTRDSGLWDLKDVLNSRQNRFKNRRARENAVIRELSKKFLAPGYGLLLKLNFRVKIGRSYNVKES